ncbi:MAG TPA: hypothetical protein VFO60_06665 [Candidatus Dormibacteraeota bacterium]|nr:hypothetical protein [Candidatus Dormibacteraeota bacterium]
MSTPSDPRTLDALSGSRTCARCGAPTRPSHRVDAGAGETVDVHTCTRCGAVFRGAVRTAADRDARGRRQIEERRARRAEPRPGRRPLDEGRPENPVLDEETAARLRELLG